MEAFFVIPGDLSQPTGGYGYDRQVLAQSVNTNCLLRHVEILGDFPCPSGQTIAETRRTIAGLPENAPLLIDGLAYGAMPEALIASFGARPIVELCHHPLALEPGLPPEMAEKLRASERAAMGHARAIIVTGAMTKRIVAEQFGVPAERIIVALPGTDPAPRAQGSGEAGTRILSVGSIIPRKGYDDLIEAMALLADLDWRLDIVGSKTHAPDTVAALERLIAMRGLSDRVILHGALPQGAVDAAYARADLFVLSSHFEGYGMVLAEAMARGLPIVATAGGAIAETLDPRAGILILQRSIQALAKEIRDMLLNPDKRIAFAEGSWAAGQALPRWADTARIIANVMREVAR